MADKRLNGGNQKTAELSITNTVANLTDSASATVSKAAEVRGFALYNPNDFPVWLKIFNGAASTITLSSDGTAEVYELNPMTVTYKPADSPIHINTLMSYAVTRESGAGNTTPILAVTGKITFGTA